MVKKGKRMIAAILSFALTVSSAGLFANGTSAVRVKAETEGSISVWDGTADTSWYTGDKMSYDISTAEQLAGLSQIVGSVGDDKRFEGITVNLTSDILLNDTTGWRNWETNPPQNAWTPIGKIGSPVMGYRPFAGYFNGNGHTIRGMYVNGGEICGLFTYTYAAVIKDLHIEKSYVQANSGTVPFAGTFVGLSEGTYLEGCSAKNVIVSGIGEYPIANEGAVGGLVGVAKRQNYVVPFMYVVMLGFGIALNPLYFNEQESGNASGTYFYNCTVTNATVKAACSGSDTYVGGMIGHYRGHDGIIAQCNTNNVKVSSVDRFVSQTLPCGGIYGYKSDANVKVADSFCSNFKRTDSGTQRSDADNVPEKDAPIPPPEETQTIRMKYTSIRCQAKDLKTAALTFDLGISADDNAEVRVSDLSRKKKIKINKSGTVTVAKGTKKGTYKVNIKISAKATEYYKAASLEKTVTVKVK